MYVNCKKILLRFLIFLIICAFIIFILLDIGFYRSYISFSLFIKYSIVILCFIISILIGRDGASKIDTALIIGARFFTLMADYYLMLLENYKLGILCFCVVQLLYILRHSLIKKKAYKNIIILSLAGVLCYFILIDSCITIGGLDCGLVRTACVYAVLLVTSLYCSISLLKSDKVEKTTACLIAAGMLLFFLCDINVALYNIFESLFLQKYAAVTVILAWIFYAPSQLMLTLSGFKKDYLSQIFDFLG